jgi:hypothetical protein
MATTSCTYHCATCGRHFASLTAFDRHRTGPWEDRNCSDPEDLDMTGLKGTCNLTSSRKHKGTVWTTRSLE